MPFLRRKEKPPEVTPAWLKLGVALFAVYALSYAIAGKSPVQDEMNSNLKKIDWDKQFNFEEYKARVFPGSNTSIKVKNNELGTGPEIVCGQQVDIRYEAFLSDGTKADENLTHAEPLTVTPGQDRAMPALEQGVLGMRVGGKRTITAASRLAFGAPGFAEDYPQWKDFMVRFEVEAVAARPEIPAPPADIIGARAFDISQNSVLDILGCGDEAHFRIAVWNADGSLLFSNMDKKLPYSTITLGASQAPRSVEEALLGMSGKGQSRTVIAPGHLNKPLYPAPLKGTALNEFFLPPDQLVVMDIATFQVDEKK